MTNFEKLFDNNGLNVSDVKNKLDIDKLSKLFDDVVTRFINIRKRLESVRDSLLILRKTARSLGKPVNHINNSLKIVYFYLYGFKPSVDVNILGNIKTKSVKGTHAVKLIIPWKTTSYTLKDEDIRSGGSVVLFNADNVVNNHQNEFIGGLAKRGVTGYINFGFGDNKLLAEVNSLISKIKNPTSSDDVVKKSFMKLVAIVREMIAFCDAATGSWLQMIGSFLTKISSKHLEVESKKRLLNIINLIRNSKVVGKQIVDEKNITKKDFITLTRNGQHYDWSVIGLPILIDSSSINLLDNNLNDYTGFKMSDDLGLIIPSLKGYRIIHFNSLALSLRSFPRFIRGFKDSHSFISIPRNSVFILPFTVKGESILTKDNKLNPNYDKALTDYFKAMYPNYAEMLWGLLKNKEVETVFTDSGNVITVTLDGLSNVRNTVSFSPPLSVTSSVASVTMDEQKIQLIPFRLSSIKKIVTDKGYSEEQFDSMIKSIFNCNNGVCTSETLDKLGIKTANNRDLFLALFKKKGDGFSLLTKLKSKVSLEDVEFMMILSRTYDRENFQSNYDGYLDKIVGEY